jgi:hypothetical protein
MRSSRFFWACFALVFACDHRNDRVIDVCDALWSCTEYVDRSKCRDKLQDALADERITRAGITSCADCLSGHEYLKSRQSECDEPPCENCESILMERDCDTACSEVDYALRSRTSIGMRKDMCDVIDSSCGRVLAGSNGAVMASRCALALDALYYDLSGLAGAGSVAPAEARTCEEATEPNGVDAGVPLTIEEALELDATVETCWKCTQSVKASFAKAERRVDRCDALVDSCMAACELVRPASAVLTDAAAALALCDLSARCYDIPGADSSAGSGGEGGSASEPKELITCGAECGADGTLATGAGGAAADPSDVLAECFDERVSCRDTAFQTRAALCVDCARNQECSYVYEQCQVYCGGGSP